MGSFITASPWVESQGLCPLEAKEQSSYGRVGGKITSVNKQSQFYSLDMPHNIKVNFFDFVNFPIWLNLTNTGRGKWLRTHQA